MRRNVLFLMAMCVLFVCGCPREDKSVNCAIYTTSRDAGNEKWIIQWGESNDGQLLFAAFEGVPRDTVYVSGLITSKERKGVTYGIVRTPNGQLKVPGTVKLFEMQAGVYRQSNQSVSLKAFKSFLQSQTNDYSIESLIRWADANEQSASAPSGEDKRGSD